MDDVALSFMAHPDDTEFLCGGTLALLARLGWKVHIAAATAGDCGSGRLAPEVIAAVRREEGAAAARVLGGQFHCLEQRDLRVFYNDETLLAACALLRKVRPRIVLTHSPSDYLPDHEQVSMLARAAAFAAPIPNFSAPGGARPLEAIPHLYYTDPIEGKDPLGTLVRPTLLIDIGEAFETKIEMLGKHASQREWLRAHHGLDEYLEGARRWARERGRLAGVEAAEGFRQHLGHAYPQDDLLAFTLRERAILHLSRRRRRTS
ncbi:MAG TPA: PIG-L family deacetylase [Planctomycetota bacterium]|nr:PIG-L family deacetylase [Planctomycetota bacterium]